MRIYYHLLETNTKQQIVKDKEDCASIATSYTKINKQIADYRQKKRHQFDLLQKATRYEVSDKNCTTNEASPKEIKHTCLAATCVIMGDSIITGIDEKKLSKNRLGTVHDFRAATLTDVTILHVGTNDTVSRTSREILDDLLQHKSAITKNLPNCQVIFSQPTHRVDNGKAALTLHYLTI